MAGQAVVRFTVKNDVLVDLIGQQVRIRVANDDSQVIQIIR
jgi:hypothetical protein